MKTHRRTLTVMLCATLAGPLAAAGSAASDVWTIASGEIDPTNYYGATLANGMIGLRSAVMPFRTEQTLIYGAYDTLRPGYVGSIVSSFNFLNLALAIDGERIERPEQLLRLRQRLQLKQAALITSFDYQDKATIVYTLRALRHLPHTALLEVTVRAKRPLTISPTTQLEAHPSLTMVNASYNTVQSYRSEANPKDAQRLRVAQAKSSFGKHDIAASHGFVFDEPLVVAPDIRHEEEGLSFTKPLAAGATYRFALVGATMTSAHASDPLSEVQRMTLFAAVQGIEELTARHEREWHELWKSSIVIEGDPETQRDVNGMLYYLYSFIREGSGYSISPMGLSRGDTGYLGHIYWDAEVWMFPVLLALKPALAKTMLDYRYDRLAVAKRRAMAYGFRGAMFPWESADSGDEDSPNAGLCGPLQHHITADIGIAAWNYYRVMQDREWLREKGYPLIKETADFWVGRVARNGPGRYDITHVVAPDEYAEDVDNDAFTNAAARENLAAATAAAKVLRLTPDPEWEHVRQNIPILTFPNGITREHATYNGEMIKQADVNLLAYPLREITDPKAIRRDLEYYESRYDKLKGPAMTASIFAILYHRLGEEEKALQMFKQGYLPLERPPFDSLAEHATGRNPYFVTAAGGLLQTLLYGFGGLEITDKGIVQKPSKLPHAWKSMIFTGISPAARTFAIRTENSR